MKKIIAFLIIIILIAHGATWYTISSSIRDEITSTLNVGVLLPNGQLAKMVSGDVSLGGYPLSTKLTLNDAKFQTLVGKRVVHQLHITSSPKLDIPWRSNQMIFSGLNTLELSDLRGEVIASMTADDMKLVIMLEDAPLDTILNKEDASFKTNNIQGAFNNIVLRKPDNTLLLSASRGSLENKVVYFQDGDRNGLKGNISIEDINAPFYQAWLSQLEAVNTAELYNQIEKDLNPYFVSWDEKMGTHTLSIKYEYGTPVMNQEPLFHGLKRLKLEELALSNKAFALTVEADLFVSPMYNNMPVGDVKIDVSDINAPIDYYLGAVSRIMEAQHQSKGNSNFDQENTQTLLKDAVIGFTKKSGQLSDLGEFSASISRSEQGTITANGYPFEEVENAFKEMQNNIGKVLISTSKSLN